ncbi:MAG: hypothetical protein B6244_05865 [Candidatus Cloacimonetes bacterium 4572_55]|nr:MAG: hypothetical protein B6244_05865 [Candidatus Cloacimonetes bacterium 4572_55]
MSMKKMRDYSKVFIWLMAIAFILSTFVLWGMQYSPSMQQQQNESETTNVAAEINGDKIMINEFRRAFEQALNQREVQDPDLELTDQDIKQIRSQTLRDLTDQILFDQQVKKHGIQVTYEEVAEELKTNPPDFLKSTFIDSMGVFNYAEYITALKQADDSQLRMIEQTLMNYLPRKKLQDKVQASVRVGDLEAWEDFVSKNEKVKIKYISVDLNQVDQSSVTATGDEIQKYYNENKDDYKQPEQRIADYVQLEIKMSPEDHQELTEKRKMITEELASGADFAELASQYSQDTGSGAKGGDLGFFGRNQMVKPFEETAFRLEDNEMSDWIKSRFGWHLILRHSSKMEKDSNDEDQEKIHASHILLKEEPSNATKNEVGEAAYKFSSDVSENPENFQSLAEAAGLTVNVTKAFTEEGGMIAGLGRMPDAVSSIFSKEIGEPTSKFDMGGDKGYAIFRLKEIIPEGFKEFDQVKEMIKNKLIREKRLERAGAIADSLYQVVQNGTSFEGIAEADSDFTVQESEEFTRSSYVKNIGRDNDVTRAAFILSLNTSSKPLKTNKAYYLIQVLEHKDADKEKFEKEKSSIKTQLLAPKQNTAFNEWFTEVRDQAEIVDNLDQFYK